MEAIVCATFECVVAKADVVAPDIVDVEVCADKDRPLSSTDPRVVDI